MISPQGYKLGAAPGSENPFWGEGEDSDVNKIFATATVDGGTGVPSVTTTKQISGNDIVFGFNFHNLKGERGATGATGATGPQGEQGEQGEKGADGFSPQVILTPIPEGYHMKIIDATGEQEITIADGKDGATGPQGAAGKDGVSPSAMVEQTGDNEATIYVTDASGTTAAVLTGEAGPEGPAGPQGEKGDTGATGPEGPQGEKGDTGATGPAGPGVAAGGTAGQVLTKKSATDYDTEWTTPSAGGKGVLQILNFNISLPDSIPADTYVEISEQVYVSIDWTAYGIAYSMKGITIQNGTGELLVANFEFNTSQLYWCTVKIRVYNAGKTEYKRSDYPSNPNNVIGDFYAIGIPV